MSLEIPSPPHKFSRLLKIINNKSTNSVVRINGSSQNFVLNNTFIKRFSYNFFRQDEQDRQDSHLIYPDNPV